MKLKMLNSSKYKKGNIKCSIHQSGKLGFSFGAIEELDLDANKHIGFGINEDDKKDASLYMKIYNSEKEEAFKVIKAGNYFYLNAKRMFDDLGLDYRKKNYIFDIIEIDYEGEKIYKLNRREYDRKQKS